MSTKVASLYAEIGANTTGFEKGSKKVKGGLKDIAGSVRDFIPPSVTSFLSLSGAVTGVAIALKGTMDETVKYANDVRTLSQLSGESTEETSRFIQVLDDYKISAADALVATRALTKEGHTPSIETLAKLSDQYLALNTAEEKNEFVLKNLGRGGLQWVEVLNKGSKALLEQGEAVNKGLILSQKMVDAARKNEIATDNWNDSVQALKISIGNQLLPIMTEFTNDLNASMRAQEILGDEYNATVIGTKKWNDALAQAKEEQKLATEAMLQNADAIDVNTKSAEENAAAQKELSDSLSNQIGLINSIQAAEDSYTEKSNDLAQQRMEKEAEVASLRAQGYSEYGKDIQNALSDLEDIKQAEAELAAERERQSLQFVSELVAQQLARDGWTQSEFDAFAEQQQAWGLWSADVVSKAKRAWMEADRVTASINGIPSSKTSTIYVNTISSYSGGTGSGYIPGNPNKPHAEGGSFMIPQSYGNEGFRMGGGDTASGGETLTITPKGQTVIDYKRLTRAIRDGMAQSGA